MQDDREIRGRASVRFGGVVIGVIAIGAIAIGVIAIGVIAIGVMVKVRTFLNAF